MSMQSEHINELTTALIKVQSKLKPAKFNAINPFFKSKYADLNSIWESCRELLSANGLAVIQTIGYDDSNAPIITTTLAHITGQWISGSIKMQPTKNDPQSVGSAITYGRRYALSAMIGIVADEDDDGNATMSKTDEQKTPAKKTVNKSQFVSEKQRARLYAKTKASEIPDEIVKDYLKSKKIESSYKIKKTEYDAICDWADNYRQSRMEG